MGGGPPAVLQKGKVSGFLVELAPGATPLQARFAILSTLKGVKVVTGDSTMSGIRQGLAALLNGILALMVLMFASTALMVSVLFSAIVTERRGELGLLKAIGARRSQIVGMMVIEAVIATGAGGALGVVLGVLVMRLYERSLVYYLENIGVPFVWLDGPRIVIVAVAAILMASIIGALGSLYPARRASRRDPTISCAARADAMLSCRGVRKDYVTERGEVAAVAGIDLDVRGRSLRRDHRPLGLGQVVADGDDRWPQPSVARQVLVDGTDIWSLSENDLAAFRNKRIGYVFQFASLLPTLRLIDNVALPAMLGRVGATRPPMRGPQPCWARWGWAIISTPIRPRSRPASSGGR